MHNHSHFHILTSHNHQTLYHNPTQYQQLHTPQTFPLTLSLTPTSQPLPHPYKHFTTTISHNVHHQQPHTPQIHPLTHTSHTHTSDPWIHSPSRETNMLPLAHTLARALIPTTQAASRPYPNYPSQPVFLFCLSTTPQPQGTTSTISTAERLLMPMCQDIQPLKLNNLTTYNIHLFYLSSISLNPIQPPDPPLCHPTQQLPTLTRQQLPYTPQPFTATKPSYTCKQVVLQITAGRPLHWPRPTGPP